MSKKTWPCPLESGFFGLGSDYRPVLYDQIFDLMYYGKMGWSWTELYNLPVYLRRYYYLKLSKVKKDEHNAEKAAYDKAKSGRR